MSEKIDFSAQVRDMNPIETEYKGYWFRSRLEARWAVFFEEVGLSWWYEVQGFKLEKNQSTGEYWYLPDFYLPDVTTPWEKSTEVWVEVKGVMKEKSKKMCRRLAIESECPVLLIQGDPVDDYISIYRKHTPNQRVRFAFSNGKPKIAKTRLGNPAQVLLNAEEKARSKRF